MPDIGFSGLVDVTSSSLLEGLRDPRNGSAWDRAIGGFRPLLIGYFRRVGVGESDAEDVAQATLLEFARGYAAGFDRSRGRLRQWLFGIARNQLANFRRRERRQPHGPGWDSRSTAFLDRQPGSAEMEDGWDREWRSFVIGSCLAQIAEELEPTTLEAFRLYALCEIPTSQVASELSMTENAVYCAKRRVLARLRELVNEMERTL